MSSLVVRVCTIDEVREHPNADRLSLATVGGWQCVVPKDRYQAGDHIIYVPPDTVLPQEWTDRLGVTNYCSPVSYLDTPHYRIRCTRLRGEPSFGLVVGLHELPDGEYEEGEGVAALLGAQKWEPPVKTQAGDAVAEHPLFPKFTEIENLRHYPRVLLEGEDVVLTEKIHGTCCRVGLINSQFLAGSKGLQRAEPANYAANTYWFPLSLLSVRALLETLGQDHQQVILYGEVYGQGIQRLHYGRRGLAFAAFDILVDGKYLDYPAFLVVCERFDVPRVPEVARLCIDGGWLDEVRRLADGESLLGGNIREGVVVRPLVGRTDPTVGRVLLKFVGDSYLLSKQEDTADH